MPEICRFLGIVIGMFYREHGPPHFHAVYGEYEVTVEIETGIYGDITEVGAGIGARVERFAQG